VKKSVLIFVVSFFLIFFSIASLSALSIVVHVPEKYTDVQAGERFYFEIEIKFPENPSRQDLRLGYEILDEENNVIAQSKVLKAIETQASFIDFIVIPESAKKGLHVIKVGVSDYEVLSEEVSASFNVVRGEGQLKLYFFILLGVIILVGVLVVINIFITRGRRR